MCNLDKKKKKLILIKRVIVSFTIKEINPDLLIYNLCYPFEIDEN